MELRSALNRWALRRPHVLLVAAPGSTALRWDVEAALQRRGWPHAIAPADTDLLLTVGDLGDELAAAADLLWTQIPRPRVRAALDAGAVERGLDDAADALLAAAQDRRGHRGHGGRAPTGDARGDRDKGAERTAGEHETDGHDMGGDHHMGGDDMGGDVAGLPMAGGAPDRDGLELDALRVSLGPVLPGWPTALVVTATLQGDVLTEVRAAVAGQRPARHGEPVEPDGAGHPTMAALDAVERVLLVAGWATASRDAARLRSQLWAAGATTPELGRRGRRLTTAVRRSQPLAWALRDLRGVLPRLHGWCDVVENGLTGSVAPEAVDLVPTAELARLLDGLDLGSARLVVASLPMDLVTVPVVAAAHRMTGGVAAALTAALGLGALAAVVDRAVVGTGPRDAAADVARATARLLLTQARTTIAPDRLLWRVGVVSVPVVAVLAAAVLPVGGTSLIATSADLVWFNAMEALLWAAVWLVGWGPNSVHPLVGGYRFLAQGLAYELPLMFSLITAGLAAGSLRTTDVVAAQTDLWFVVTMPVAFVVFLVGAAAFTFWGPFSAPASADIAGGVLAELSGPDRLLVQVGRYTLLGVSAAMAAALFLGGGNGPLLPDAVWHALKTVAVLTALVVVGRRLPVVRPDRFVDVSWMVLVPLTLLQALVVAVLVLAGVY